MGTNWYDLPDAGDDILAAWAVPLDEPPTVAKAAPAPPPAPLRDAGSEPSEPFLLRGDDGLLSSEFHPRLRRFGEGE